MAGGLNTKLIPSCQAHGTPCYIKTGTSEGPNKGKSFFICGNSQEQCGFVRPATGISNSYCPDHGKINDLSALCKKEDELRFYYRCTEGKKLCLGWCGHEKLKTEQCHGLQSLSDITNLMKERMNRKIEDKLKSREKKDNSLAMSSAVIPDQGKENSVAGRNDYTERTNGFSNIGKDNSNSSNDLPSRKNSKIIDLTDSDSDQDDPRNDQKSSVTEEKRVKEVDKPLDNNKEQKDLNGVIEMTKKRHAVEREIAARKNILKKIDRSKLPDNGQRLVDQISSLEEMLKKLKESRSCGNEDDLSLWSSFTYTQNDKFENTKTTEKSGLNLNFNLPPSQSSAILVPTISNPQQRLYDGRMTHSKLQQVGRVTRDAIEALHRSLDTCPTSTTECEDPIGLNVTLMTHQRQALAWLLWREKQSPSGGILADDMGLGKTLTSISLIMKDKQVGFQKKEKIPADMRDSSGTLVVCPASLVHQWKSEIEKRVKPLNLTVCLYHGPSRERNIERLSRYDVVLTTYSIVATETKGFFKAEEEKKKSKDAWLTTEDAPDIKERKKNRDSLISQIHWRRIVLDEAHNIKNHKCITSIATCYIEAESRWALTGTPIQNDTMDLYAIIKFLRCSPFNELKVWKRWVDDKSTRGTERMNTLVKSLLLRRTKEQKDSIGKPLVALPSREALVHNVNLTGNEKEIYTLLHLYSKNMLQKFLQDKAHVPTSHPTGSNATQSSDSQIDLKKRILGKDFDELLDMFGLLHRQVNAGAILLMVLRLRQCCSHLSLLCEVLDEETCKEEGVDIPLEEQLMNMSIQDDFKSDWNPEEFKSSFVSTKIQHLLTELEKLNKVTADGKPIKSVVVSQWTKMLDIVAFHLRKKRFKYDFITGSVSVKKRNEIVENFNCNPYGTQVMLVSLKAGGVGLNLIGGSHLFLLDQHWNPALENQASDRIYRVGQKYNVVIHRFLCTDTVEEKITALQNKKRAIADTVLKGGKQATQRLTLQDLRTLFGV